MNKSLARTLYSIEAWERFSYFGLRSVLVLFFVRSLGMGDHDAYKLNAIFAGLATGSPILGGIIADRYLGYYPSVILGALLMFAGHTVFIFAETSSLALYGGLGLLILGGMFFRGNIAILLGRYFDAYPGMDRQKGFQFFYVSINIGSILACILCNVFVDTLGFKVAFAFLALGLTMPLCVLLSKRAVFAGLGEIQKKSKAGIETSIAKTLLPLLSFYLGFFTLEVLCWSVINLFAIRHVSFSLGSLEIPSGVWQAINPIAVMLGGVFLPRFEISKSISKAFFLMVLCYASLSIGCYVAGQDGLVSCLFLIAALSFMGIAEIFMAPPLYAKISEAAPPRSRGFWMGSMYLSLALSYPVSGLLTSAFVPKGMEAMQREETIFLYQEIFIKISLVAGVLFVLAELRARTKKSRSLEPIEKTTSAASSSTRSIA